LTIFFGTGKVTDVQADFDKVLPASELRRLTQGSFEHKIEQVREAVEDAFDPEKSVLLACYSDSAVVSVGDKFFKVRVEEADSGHLAVTGREALVVDVRSPDDVDDLIEQEALGVVSLWLAGQVDKAKARLRALAPQVRATSSLGDSKLVDSVETVLKGDRPWKRAYQERQSQIREMLGSDLVVAELRPKFRKLYDGSTPPEKLAGYQQLVTADLSTIVGRLDRISESAKTAFERSREVLTTAQSSEQDDSGVLDLYEGFSVDLIEDLEQMKRQTAVAAKRIRDVGYQGKLRDVLADGLASYEVAGKFVEKVAGLLEAQEE
jgi:hypothetical protein